ncbi:MAG: hypothetical protein ABJC12_12410, partial [Saprospiraceae bacterium]
TNLDYFGSTAGDWTENANDIYNINSGNVGVGITTPYSKLTVDGDLALLSDTIRVSCGFLPPPNLNLVIDHVVKDKSVLHIVDDGCSGIYFTPVIVGLTSGADGKIVSIVSHVNNLPIKHLQGTTPIPSAADSLNMIELYEPNGNGPINQPSSLILNNGGSVTLIYDGARSKWKVLGVYGEVKTETVGWLHGPDPNDIYNPNSGKVGIGTGAPGEKLDVNGNAKVRSNLFVDGNLGVNIVPVEKLDVNGNAKVRNNLLVDGNIGIGITNPQFPISIKTDGYGYLQQNTTGATMLGIHTANGIGYIGTLSNNDFRLGVDQQSIMSITTYGNVGIGIFNPNASLSVARGNGTDGTAAFFGTTNASHFNYGATENTYIRGGKNTSKVYINDFGGQVAIGTLANGTAQLNVVSSQTGSGANGISVLQTTTNTGNDSYGINLTANGSNLRNFGILANAGGSGQIQNTAGLFTSTSLASTGSNIGVEGQASNSNINNYAGKFAANGGLLSTENFGIHAEAHGPGTTYGVYGYATTSGAASGSQSFSIYGYGGPIGNLNYAGYFDGFVQVNGSLYTDVIQKGSGSFLIDHPQDPANKYLYHSFVESPDMMNIYNGNIVTDNAGVASVQLPEYFFTLNKDFRYQLTVMGQFAQAIISEEINNSNQFKIKTDKPNVKVSWQVTGVRQDAWANAHRIIPEVEKEERNKGKYLHPEVFGQPVEMGIHYAKPPVENK